MKILSVFLLCITSLFASGGAATHGPILPMPLHPDMVEELRASGEPSPHPSSGRTWHRLAGSCDYWSENHGFDHSQEMAEEAVTGDGDAAVMYISLVESQEVELVLYDALGRRICGNHLDTLKGSCGS